MPGEIDQHGDASVRAHADAIMNRLDFLRPECSVEELARPEFIADEFAAAGIESKNQYPGGILHQVLKKLTRDPQHVDLFKKIAGTGQRPPR